MNSIFPTTADNNYRGNRIAPWVLLAFVVLFFVRSLIHVFKADGGANSIASIITFSGSPDPDQVIYLLFALWGGQQLVTAFIMAIVLWRYRSLVPLMFLVMIIEQLTRIGAGMLKPLSADFYAHTPPGVTANVPILIIAVVMLVLSLRPSAKSP